VRRSSSRKGSNRISIGNHLLSELELVVLSRIYPTAKVDNGTLSFIPAGVASQAALRATSSPSIRNREAAGPGAAPEMGGFLGGCYRPA